MTAAGIMPSRVGPRHWVQSWADAAETVNANPANAMSSVRIREC